MGAGYRLRIPWFLLFVVLGGAASSTLINAPGILVGYGLIDVVLLLASWLFPPIWAALSVLGSMLVAIPILYSSKAMFINVAILHLVARPILAYTSSWIRLRRGIFTSTMYTLALESLLAVGLAILYYGGAGMETGLVVFSVLLAPYAYMIYLSIRESNVFGAVVSAVSLLTYYLAFYAFPAVITGVSALISLIIMTLWLRMRITALPPLALIISLLGLALGGTALSYNLTTALYAFNPHNWGDDRWAQLDPTCPPTSNVFENTYSPSRLRIVRTCATVVGVVTGSLSVFGDGDFTFDVKPYPNYTGMLSIGSLVLRGSTIHIEVVPADQEAVLKPIGGVCVGDLVKVTGVFVIDTDHGLHSELHPAYRIEILSRALNKSWPDCIINPPPEFREEGS